MRKKNLWDAVCCLPSFFLHLLDFVAINQRHMAKLIKPMDPIHYFNLDKVIEFCLLWKTDYLHFFHQLFIGYYLWLVNSWKDMKIWLIITLSV